MLGELALIADSHRLTGAVAATDTEVMRLNRKLFRRILEEYPDVALFLHHRITADFQTMVAKLEHSPPRFSDF